MADRKTEKESAKAKVVRSISDKILQHATAIDAAIAIVQQKLLKLLECKLITSCKSLKQQIQDIRNHLDPVYEFLTSHLEGSDRRSEWNSRLLDAIYQLEDGIDSFRARIALQDPNNVYQTIGIGCPNMFLILRAKFLLWTCLQEFKSQITILKEVEKIPKQSKDSSSSSKEKTSQIHDTIEWDKLFSHDVLVNHTKDGKTMKELMEPLMATEVEETRITSPEVEQTRITVPEVEQTRITAPEVEETRITAPEAEQTTIMAPEGEQTTTRAPEGEQTTTRAPEAEQTTTTAPEAEQTTSTAPEAEQTTITAITGERGIGKTYVARRIFTELRDHFDCCAWVNVATIDTPDRVLHDLLKQVLDMSSWIPDVQQQGMRLREMLWKALYGKRYLIVLDDVGDFSVIVDVLGSLLDLQSSGGIIITTQDKDLAQFIDPSSIDLNRLNECQIKELVKAKLEIAGRNLDEQTWKKAKKVFTEKCHRSPLRLNLLSGLIAESHDPVEKLINEIPDDDLDRLSARCYNKMPQAPKPCLLYMVLFPKGYLIPVRRLLRLWLSEGFLDVPPGAKREPEDLGHNFLKELVIRNFIEVVTWKEDGSPRRVRVVSSLYDLLRSRAIGTELLYIINTHKETEDESHQHQQEQSSTTRLRWLVEQSDIKEMTLSSVSKINHLRSFLSFNFREGTLTQDIGYFLKMVSGKGFNFLNVLDLEDVYKPNLDKVLEKLVLLKHLGLRSTALDSIPKSIADLPYLETLDLKHTNITELPKSFWKRSRNLRHLYLNGYCYINKSNFSSSFETSNEPMANLRTLSGAVVDSICVDRSTDAIEGFRNMKKLTKLGITFKYNHENQKAIGDWISSLTNLQSLKLGIVESGKPAALPSELSLSQHHSLSKLYLLGKFEGTWRIRLPLKLITLTLSGSQMTNDHIIQIGKLPNLKVLNLRANSFTGECFKLPVGLTQKLEVLRLWKLKSLQKIELSEKIELSDELPNIKTIEVRSCPEMKEIEEILRVAYGRTSRGDFVSIGKKTISKRWNLQQVRDRFSNEIKDQAKSTEGITIKMSKDVPDPCPVKAAEEVKKANAEIEDEVKEVETQNL